MKMKVTIKRHKIEGYVAIYPIVDGEYDVEECGGEPVFIVCGGYGVRVPEIGSFLEDWKYGDPNLCGDCNG